MSYIGSTPTTQNFIAGTDQFTGDGSTTNFTLSRFVNSPNDIQVTIANVVQNPTSYLVSGNTLTISPAVSSGIVFYVRYLSTTLQSITIPPGSSVPGNFGLSGNLQFLGSAQRITGDFSNATVANRVMFQTSTVNGNSQLGVLPNGTATSSNFAAHNAADPTNASRARMQVTNTTMSLESDITGTGTYLPMTFYTGGSERMRLDTSGNVGIGTNAPTSKFEVLGNGTFIGQSFTNLYTAGEAINFIDARNSSGVPDTNIFFAHGTDGSGYLTFGTTPAGSKASDRRVERMRIDPNGNLLVGTPSQVGSARFGVEYNGASFWGASFNDTNGTSGNRFIDFRRIGTSVGSITLNGTTAVAYNTSSDYRLKENVHPMTGALAKVAALKPCTYTWKADGSAGEGFIAHELAEVVPQCVTGEKDAVDANGNPVYQGIDTSFLVATLTAAIQEQQAMIEELRAEVAALKGQ